MTGLEPLLLPMFQAGAGMATALGAGATGAAWAGSVAATAGLGLGMKGISKLLKPKAPPPQAVPEKPKVMPLADDEKTRAAKRQSLARQRTRGGRQSTIKTALDEAEGLGG